jgi:hypothetical protein
MEVGPLKRRFSLPHDGAELIHADQGGDRENRATAGRDS